MNDAKIIFLVLFFSWFYDLKAQNTFHAEAAIHQLDSVTNPVKKVRLLNELSGYYINSNISKAEKYASLALETAKNNNDTLGIADSQYSMGCVFLYTYYDLSFELIMQALQVYRSKNDTLKTGKCYIIFGILKSNMREYNEALTYYLKALQLFELKKDTSYIASSLNNIGTCYGDLKEHAKAIEYFEKALQLNIRKNNRLYLSINYSNLGQVYVTLNDFSMARSYLGQCWNIKKELNDVNGLANLYGILGNLNLQTNHDDSALYYFNMSLKLARNQHNFRLQEPAAQSLAEIYKKQGNTDSAFYWLEQLLVIKDSLSGIEKTNNLNMLEMRLRYEDMLKSISVRHHEKVFFLSVTIFILLLSFLVAVSIIFLLNLRRKRIRLLNEKIQNEKKLLNEMVDLKNREISSNMLNLASKNELIKRITTQLSNGIENNSELDKNYIQKIIRELNQTLNKNIWKEFELRFNQVHPDFYNNLLRDYPNLTPNELKLCAFLRSGMSSKEISSITHQSVDSIEKARIRLRKKLNINDTGANINSFLSKF